MSWKDRIQRNWQRVFVAFVAFFCLHLQVDAEPVSQTRHGGTVSGSGPDPRALWDAVRAKDMRTLDALLPTRTPPEPAKPWQVQLVLEFAYSGQLELLRLVHQKNYPFDHNVVRLALESMKLDVIRFSLQATRKSFESLCFDFEEPGAYAARIVEAMKWSSNSEWTDLLDFGLMRIPRRCAADADARDTRSRAEIVGRYLMCDPLAVTGAWATLLPERVAEMRKYVADYEPERRAFRQSLQSCLFSGKRYHEGDVLPEEPSMDSAFPAALKPLAEALGMERLLFDDVKIPPPPASAMWLADRYEGRTNFRYSNEPQGLRLSRDGTFEWEGSSDLGSARARGRWTVPDGGARKGTLFLRSDNSTDARLRVVETTRYPEPSREQRPVFITVRSAASDGSDPVHVYAFSESKPLSTRQISLNERTKWEIDGAPTMFAVLLGGPSQQTHRLTTNARQAFEVRIPDPRNLKSAVLELDVPPIDALWMGYARTSATRMMIRPDSATTTRSSSDGL